MSLDSFVISRPVVQVHSPAPYFLISQSFTITVRECTRFRIRIDALAAGCLEGIALHRPV